MMKSYSSCNKGLLNANIRCEPIQLATRISRPRSVAVWAAEQANVLVAEKLSDAGLEMLQGESTVDCSYTLSPEDLLVKIKDADALIVRSATKVTREVFEAANGRLKVVGRAGVGIDNIDLAAATEYGCLVVNAPTANTVAAAEHGIALMCALSRNVAQANSSMKEGKWERSKYVGVGLAGKKLCIFGFGKVGTEVAKRGKALGMLVYVHDPYVTEDKARTFGVKLASFDEALALGDFMSLHMPLTPLTKGIFNYKAFQKCKKGARIINVARGGVLNAPDLVKAIDEGLVAAAALDVFEVEPPPEGDAVVSHPNIICTPHLGASTTEAQEGVAVEIADAVLVALRGELSPTAVNAPMVPPEVLAELKPYVTLAQGLGKTAVQLVADKGFEGLKIEYNSSRGDDLDTRLLRAMVLKGILDETTDTTVNLVNADLLAKNRGIGLKEVTVRADGRDVLSTMAVSLRTSSSKFSAAVDSSGQIRVEGTVKQGLPYITKIGNFDVDICMEGMMMLVRQEDRPGLIASIAQLLAKEEINVSFMTVERTGKGEDAIMAIGVDSPPSQQILDQIPLVPGLKESVVLSDSP